MKKIFSFSRLFALMTLLFVGLGSAWSAITWEECAISDLVSTDVFAIVDINSGRAMTNNNGTSSAPSATTVTLNTDKDQITGEVTAAMKWNISGNATDGYVIYPNGSTTTWLYCTATNNGLRVGNNAAKTFVIANHTNDEPFLKHVGTSRYIGVYSNQDWRCYTSVNTNINATKTRFFKQVERGSDPVAASWSVSPAAPTVKEGRDIEVLISTNYDGTLEAQSNSTSIATVSIDGKVLTISGVSAGSTTISITGAATSNYLAIEKEITVTVTGATPGEAEATFNVCTSLFGLSGAGNVAADQTYTDDESNITITTGCTSSASSKTYYATNHVRFYADSYLLIAAPTGYVVSNVVINRYETDTWNPEKIKERADKGTISVLTNQVAWEGKESSLAFDFSGQCRVASVAVTIVPSKTIDFIAAGTDGYYTTFSNNKAVTIPDMIEVGEEYAQFTVYSIVAVGNEIELQDLTSTLLIDGTWYLSENEGYLIKAEFSGEIAYTGEAAISVEYTELNDPLNSNDVNNALRPASEAKASGKKYYMLAYSNSDCAPASLGFYWGAANGAAFVSRENSAYLAVEAEAAPARFVFNETTALENNAKAVKANKTLVNGQLFILRDGKTFDVVGRIVK